MILNISCQLCATKFPTRYKLKNHIKKIHKISWEEFTLKTQYNDQIPFCKCGCNLLVKFNGNKYNHYCHGHNGNGISPSLETRKKIGIKNSKHMTEFYQKNQQIAIDRAQYMRTYLNKNIIEKRNKSIRKTFKSPEYRTKMKDITHKMWHDNPEIRKLASEKASKTYQSRKLEGKYIETNKNLSKIMSDKLLNNERIWQRGIYEPKKSEGICRYKSSYELLLMNELDNLDIVLNWSYEKCSIPYIDQNKQRRYIPDFIVNLTTNLKFMIEVKPKKLHGRNLLKIEAGNLYCQENNMKYVLWEPCDGSIENYLN